MNKIKSNTLYRSSSVDETTINEEERTVEIVFSTEMAVERNFGMEVLDHSPESVDLGRMAQRGPVLVDHNPEDHVGVVVESSIDSDRIGRAKVRFGRSARATEIFNDIIDGIRGAVSVGYRIFEMKREGVEEGLEHFRATSWQPLELSFVSVPADPNCQVGRSVEEDAEFAIDIIDEVEKETHRSVQMTEEIKQEAPSVDVAAIRAEAQKAERKRVSVITELGAKFDANDMARDYVNSDKSTDSFREAILAKQERQETIMKESTPATDLGLSEKETRAYSLMNAIRAAESGNWKGAEFERECSLEIAERLGRDAQGFFVPFDIQRATNSDFTRVTPPSNTVDQANLVGTDHLAGSFIEQLRNKSSVMSMGAKLLTGLVGNVDIPKQTAGSTFGWLAEDANATDSDLTIGQATLSPKTIGGAVPLTRRLMKQSSPDIENLVRSDLIAGAALAIDLGALSGSGAAGQPLGVRNAVGINTQAVVAAGAPTFAELVGFETAVLTDNALAGNLNYITTPAMQGYGKTTVLDAGSGRFIQEGGMINGYPVNVTNQAAANSILFGNFEDVLIGMWGVLDLSVDTATKAASGGLVLRAFQDVDVAVRHAESFCKNA
jgi:HK97 family phage major capsid protein